MTKVNPNNGNETRSNNFFNGTYFNLAIYLSFSKIHISMTFKNETSQFYD